MTLFHNGCSKHLRVKYFEFSSVPDEDKADDEGRQPNYSLLSQVKFYLYRLCLSFSYAQSILKYSLNMNKNTSPGTPPAPGIDKYLSTFRPRAKNEI